MLKKTTIYTLILALSLAFVYLQPTAVHANIREECLTCNVEKIEGISRYYDEGGNLVEVFDNGVEVIYYKNGDIILNDYNHVFSENAISASNGLQRSAWIALGRVVYRAVGVCASIHYVTGHDICRIVLNYLGDNIQFGKNYTVSGNFVSGYIPGCEPIHSAPCNAGYWQYKVSQ